MKRRSCVNHTIPLLFVLLFTGVLHYTFIDLTINQDNVRLLCVWVITCYGICLSSIRKTCCKINFAYVWVLLTLLFFYSQYFGYAINLDLSVIPVYIRIFGGNIDNNSIISGLFFPLECIVIICISFCCNYSRQVNKMKISEDNYENDYAIERNTMRIVSRVLFYFTFLPTMYYCIFSIIANRVYGYSTMKYMLGEGLGKGSLLFWAVFLSGWFEVACYMLCISTNSKLESKIVRFCLLIYAVGIVLAGSRYKALEIMCGYILIDYYWFNRTNKKRLLVYTFLGIAAIVAFSAVRYLRIESYQSMDYSIMSKQMISDAILGDSSATGRINCAVMQYTNNNSFGYGISYLNGIIAILPSIIRNSLFPNLQMDISGNTLSSFSGTTNNSLGSCFCAEAFYNFGWFSLFLMFFYGLILSKVTSIHDTILRRFSPNRFVLYVYISTQMVFCIRSEVSSIIRPIFFYVLLPLIIANILTSNIKWKSNVNEVPYEQ